MDSAKLLTPGELSERSGVAISALHFYEREGLIHSERTSGNQRRYLRETLRRVAFIRTSQRVGVPLAEIRDAEQRWAPAPPAPGALPSTTGSPSSRSCATP